MTQGYEIWRWLVNEWCTEGNAPGGDAWVVYAGGDARGWCIPDQTIFWYGGILVYKQHLVQWTCARRFDDETKKKESSELWEGNPRQGSSFPVICKFSTCAPSAQIGHWVRSDSFYPLFIDSSFQSVICAHFSTRAQRSLLNPTLTPPRCSTILPQYIISDLGCKEFPLVQELSEERPE